MPFKSQKQRGWMYENKPKMAKEFEEATPEDMKLPKKAKKMSEGGEVKEGDAFTEGSKEGINHDLNHIKEVYDSFMQKHQLGTFPKLEKGVKEDFTVNSSTKNYAGGGMVQSVDQEFINKLNQGTALTPESPVPPLDQTMQAVNKTPDTNYDFYGDVGADQRKTLYDQLLQQQKGPGQLIAQGLGGLGDAISNSFGGQHNTYMKDIQGQQGKRQAGALEAFDTQRQQKLQDMQGNQEMMMNDPKHPIAMAMRKALQANGMQVPSGMPVGLMVKVAGPLGELALKQATLGVQQQVADQNQTNQVAGRKFDAAKGIQARPWYQKAAEMIPGMKSDATKVMENEMQGGQMLPPPAAPMAFPDPNKESKYQAWKASQGR